MGWSSGGGAGWDDPVVGGTILRVPAIQSPGFQSGVQGWIIRADGSAEFNSAIFRGHVVISSSSDSLLVYNGTPANGNLIASIAAVGGTDSFGNHYVQGVAGYNTPGTFTIAGSLTNQSTRYINIQSSDTFQFIDFSPDQATFNPGQISATTASGLIAIQATQLIADTGNTPQITLAPANPANSANGTINLSADVVGILTGGAGGQQDFINTAWTSFTPTWSGSVTNPALVDGTVAAAYKQIGKTVHFRIHYTFGPNTTFGSGAYGFTLPVTPAQSQTAAALCIDSSAAQRFPGAAWITAGSGIFRVAEGAGGNVGISSTVPFTWATTDELIISGTYERN